MKRDQRIATQVPDPILHDSGDLAALNPQELARDVGVRHLWADLVSDSINGPAHGVGNHGDRLRHAHVPHAPLRHPCLKLLHRQAGTDLLLNRQPAKPGVLNAVDDDPINPLAHRAQQYRQHVHREARVDTGSEHRDSRAPGQSVEGRRLAPVRTVGINQLLGRRHDRTLRRKNRFELRHHPRERRRCAVNDDIRFG